MKLQKCPRCDLNYISMDVKLCTVCLRELRGEQNTEEIELCSVCNEEAVLPGKDVCASCFKEISSDLFSTINSIEETSDEAVLNIDPVITGEDILPDLGDGLPDRDFGGMECEYSSLESIRESEDNDDDSEEEIE